MAMPPTPDRGESIVALAGDWHGNFAWAQRAMLHLKDEGVGTVYHLGDFGIWPSSAGRSWYLEKLNNLCYTLDMNIWVTPGNHENWNWLDALHGIDAGRAPRQIVPGETGTRRLFALPRGYRWTHGGRTFVSLGGAPSVDYMMRTRNQDWFAEELTAKETAEEVGAAGHAEIMLAHDVPNLDIPMLQRLLERNSGGWPAEALAYAAIGRDRLDIAFAGVNPSLYAHGHYHVQGDTSLEAGTRVLSLSKDDSGGNLVLIDLSADDFDVKWLPFGPGQEPLPVRESVDRYRDSGWARFNTGPDTES